MMTLTQHARRISRLRSSEAKWLQVHAAYESDDEISESHRSSVLSAVDDLRSAYLHAMELAAQDLQALDDDGRGVFPAGGIYESPASAILRGCQC